MVSKFCNSRLYIKKKNSFVLCAHISSISSKVKFNKLKREHVLLSRLYSKFWIEFNGFTFLIIAYREDEQVAIFSVFFFSRSFAGQIKNDLTNVRNFRTLKLGWTFHYQKSFYCFMYWYRGLSNLVERKHERHNVHNFCSFISATTVFHLTTSVECYSWA